MRDTVPVPRSYLYVASLLILFAMGLGTWFQVYSFAQFFLQACLLWVVTRPLWNSTSTDSDFLRETLIAITLIPNKTSGGDWDEIEEARQLAREALDLMAIRKSP